MENYKTPSSVGEILYQYIELLKKIYKEIDLKKQNGHRLTDNEKWLHKDLGKYFGEKK